MVVGSLRTNAYVLAADGEAALVDPGDAAPHLDTAWDGHLLRYILLTHGHFDHADGAEIVHARTGAPVLYHPDEASTFWTMGRRPPPLGQALAEGARLPLGGDELVVWHLPGHSPGSVAFLWEKGKVAVVGDVLFARSVGRSDLPGGSWDVLRRSLSRLLGLDDEWRILPGHGPATSIGQERLHNPYLQDLDHARP
ncbi:MAG: MBL-fold metallo-hydrolase superfamily [Candidatus Bipolaricaulis sibiricus]|uniref:MBL-fold metallo-hydrolase superfamily n=1 Tax=Bipolaricaulis sibiricus TaxID=2501609 RepID=A0A410FUJ1_BIPS1|nr:MAG: MBL-fold metallo-hydrolase superfamily [Candidatus Bipolaricaulis sibiricus]